MANYRTCGATREFNTGVSKCALDPDKVKGVILVQHGFKLPATLTADELKKACHANRPNRLYPIKDVIEYATSGGEAQTNATGYGANKVTGFSARTDTFTIEAPDMALRANLVKAKNTHFDMYLYDTNNVIYGVKDDTDVLAGIELTGVYPSGQDWDSSSTDANLAVNVMFKDVEKYLMNADAIVADFDVANALVGLSYVDMVSTTDGYKVVEHFGGLDITEYVGSAIAAGASTTLPSASSVSYDATKNVVKLTGDAVLAAPSVLLAADVEGIEQYKA